MNKSELVAAVAEKAGITKTDADRVVNAFTATVQETLAKGEDVSLVGFGTFSVKKRAARTGRNPLTGETMQIAEATVPAFKAGATLKSVVAQS